MNSRWHFDPERADQPRLGWWRRVSGLLKRNWLFLLLALFPLYFSVAGIAGLISGRLRVYPRSGPAHTIYGNEATTWSWIHLAAGAALLGWMLGDVTRRTWPKWLLWLVAAGCLATGVYRLVKAM